MADSLSSLSAELHALRGQLIARDAAQMAHAGALGSQIQDLTRQVVTLSAAASSVHARMSALESRVSTLSAVCQNGVATLAIMIEKLRTGDTTTIPAEMTDLVKALGRLSE